MRNKKKTTRPSGDHRYVVPLAVWWIVLCSVAYGQSISITKPDASLWPMVTVEVMPLDAQGSTVHPAADDLRIRENGIEVAGTVSLSCPDSSPATAAGILFLLDRSGSMSAPLPSGSTRLAAVKGALNRAIGAVRFNAGTAVAVTAFDALPVMVSDFRTSAAPIVAALAGLSADGATEYNPAHLDPLVGGLSLLASRPATTPRIVIFISDGEPNSPVLVDSIVARANAGSIIVHCIALGAPLSPELRAIADRTGGSAFGDVEDEESLSGIVLLLTLGAQGRTPCRLSWISPPDCDRTGIDRAVTVEWISASRSTSSRYSIPASLLPKLEADASLLWFGQVVPPATATRQLVITARNQTITMDGTSFPPGSPFSVIDWGGTPPPFTLSNGESRNLTIRFAPIDSSQSGTTLPLVTSPCPPPGVTLSGGVGSSRRPNRLQLLAPTGGEVFSGCDDVEIRWSGTEPATPVTIEASSDDGTSWWRVADSATSLRHLWSPPGNGTGYRIRIFLANRGSDAITTIAGGGAGGDGPDARSAELLSPSGVARFGEVAYIAESGGNRVRHLDLASGRISTVAGTGLYGFSNDGGAATSARMANPTDVLLNGSSIYIADFSNDRVRHVDLTDGTISTFAGDGTSGFSGDGGPATSAQFFQPSHLAIDAGGLYIVDRGNNRIRRVDLVTRRVTTVAGGGANSEGDGESALLARLDQPSGIAVTGDTLIIPEVGRHRLRAVDLRTGTITTIAGTGTAGFSGDGGFATSAQLKGPTNAGATDRFIAVADAGNNRVRMIDRLTRRISTLAGGATPGFAGDNGPPGNALLNRPGGLHLTDQSLLIADVANNRIREVRFGDAGGHDSSRSSFTVAVGVVSLEPDTILFPLTSVGSVRDTTLTVGLCNRGTFPLVIDSTWSIGPDASEFRIVSGHGPAQIPPGACRTIEIRFLPSAIGPRRGGIVLHTSCGRSDTLALQGIGAEACGLDIVERIDLGRVDVGRQGSDSITTGVICNNGSGAINGTLSLGTNNGSFTILDGAGPFTLQAGECRSVTLRFAPLSSGPQTARIDYGINGMCSARPTLLVGVGTAATAIDYPTPVDLGSIACADQVIDTTIVLRNRSSRILLISDITVVPNDGRFATTSATPLPGSPWSLQPGEERSVRVRFRGGTIGNHTASLRVTADDDTIPHDITLTGRRDSVDLGISPRLLVFDGRLGAGRYPLEQTITLHNRGTVPIEISAGEIRGGDSDRFALPAGQLPRIIGAGDSVVVRIVVLQGSGGAARRAQLHLVSTPTCDGSATTVDLVESDGGGLLVTTPPTFASLICPDDSTDETTLTLRNVGGTPVTVAGISIDGAHPNDFLLLDQPPFVIPPSDSIDLRIRFAPTAYALRTARLLLLHDGSGDSAIVLEGWRGSVVIEIPDTLIDFGNAGVGSVQRISLRVRNSGRDTARLVVPSVTGRFTFSPPDELLLAPGGDTTITVEFSSESTGSFDTTAEFRVVGCTGTIRVQLRARVVPQLSTVISLPIDSGRAGRSYAVPLRMTTTDRIGLSTRGPLTYRATLRFDGTVLWPRSATLGMIERLGFDRNDGTQTVVLRGITDGLSDTISLLHCDIPAGGRVFTTLTIVDFSWDDPSIVDSLVNGRFRVVDTCAVQPAMRGGGRITKIRPIPSRAEGSMVEIELDDDLEVSIDLVDLHGRTVATLFHGRRSVGNHEIPLQLNDIDTGYYTLVVRTHRSVDRSRLLLVR